MNTTRVIVYTVEVYGRDDGIYVFANEYDAARFARAVHDYGGETNLVEQTVCHESMTDALIAAEADSG